MVASLLLRRNDAWPNQIISAIALSFSWEGVQTHRTAQSIHRAFQNYLIIVPTQRAPRKCGNCGKRYIGGHPTPSAGAYPCTTLVIMKPPITTCGGYWWLHNKLILPGFEGEDAVLAAEAEAVDEGGADFPVARLVGDVVEVTFGVAVVVVDGGWDDAVVDGLDGGEGGHGPGGA